MQCSMAIFPPRKTNFGHVWISVRTAAERSRQMEQDLQSFMQAPRLHPGFPFPHTHLSETLGVSVESGMPTGPLQR